MADSNKEAACEINNNRYINDTLKLKNAVPLSNYAMRLEPMVKQRYMEKKATFGIDRLLKPEKTLECLPPVEATDLLSYLVLDTSYYTKSQFKAFQSLAHTIRWF